jgi:hypothetical protein
LLKSNRDSLPHVEFAAQIPDFAVDPDGSKGITKDTIVEDIPSTIRSGFWIEEELVTRYWKSGRPVKKLYQKAGYYKDGERHGDWEFGLPYFPSTGDLEIVIQTIFTRYYTGFDFYREDSVPAFHKEALLFSGNWYILKKSTPDKIYLSRNKTFADDQSAYLNFYSTYSYNGKEAGGHWSIKNNTLTLSKPSIALRYGIHQNEGGIVLTKMN